MAAKKVKDLAVKTGSYTVNGETKNRYKNVGSLMKTDDGSVFILLDTTFNPAGVPNPDFRDNVLISVFDLRDADGQRPAASTGGSRSSDAGPRQAAQTRPGAGADFADDDIPFITQQASW